VVLFVGHGGEVELGKGIFSVFLLLFLVIRWGVGGVGERGG